jgi:hypothetical protein
VEVLEGVSGQVTPAGDHWASVFRGRCKERFSDKDLGEAGNAFAHHYYVDEAERRGAYFADYKKVLVAGLPSFWHVADTRTNYEQIAAVITRRYEDCKNPPPAKRWWQFWK